MNDGRESYIGWIGFFSFALSVIAAVLAIDMYALLRTGQFGKTWRVLIIASVMFALTQALRLAEALNMESLSRLHLSEVAELMFVMSLTYAFYLQRSVFTDRKKERQTLRIEQQEENERDDETVDEWERINGYYDGPITGIDEPLNEINERRSTQRHNPHATS